MPQPPQWFASVAVSTQPTPGQQVDVAPTHTSPAPTLPDVAPQVHRPDEQVSPAPQLAPQAPQLVVDVTLVSQPLPSFPSQLPRPELHAWIRQLIVAQVAVAFDRAHDTPHPPQFVRVRRSVSHPLVVDPSQLSKPALHEAMAQAPSMHRPVAWAGAQRAPHRPQWAASLVTSVSQPSPAAPRSPLQSSRSGVAGSHSQIRSVQTALGPHTTPQPPQSASLPVMSRHAPSQQAMDSAPPPGGSGHACSPKPLALTAPQVQRPIAQISPSPQAIPHPPQWFGSLATS